MGTAPGMSIHNWIEFLLMFYLFLCIGMALEWALDKWAPTLTRKDDNETL
jgi:hypothetical protein